jgi:hypothetical protein
MFKYTIFIISLVFALNSPSFAVADDDESHLRLAAAISAVVKSSAGDAIVRDQAEPSSGEAGPSNPLPPIHLLPPEVLCNIFYQAVKNYSCDPVVLGSVCFRWDSMVNHPSFRKVLSRASDWDLDLKSFSSAELMNELNVRASLNRAPTQLRIMGRSNDGGIFSSTWPSDIFPREFAHMRSLEKLVIAGNVKMEIDPFVEGLYSPEQDPSVVVPLF